MRLMSNKWEEVAEVKVDELRKKIQIALEVVSGVPEQFKAKAFEVILSQLLKETLTVSKVSESKALDEKVTEFARKIGIEAHQLSEIYEFGEKEPIFIATIKGTEAEKQFLISRCLLLAYKEVYNQEWINGSTLWRHLKDCGVQSLKNLSRNLDKHRDEIMSTGKGTGKRYKLTQKGRKNATNFIKQLINRGK